MKVMIGSYKGNPTITLGEGKFPFTFGLAKAKLILECLDAIKAFVAQHDKPAAPNYPAGARVRDPGEDAADRYSEGSR